VATVFNGDFPAETELTQNVKPEWGFHLRKY